MAEGVVDARRRRRVGAVDVDVFAVAKTSRQRVRRPPSRLRSHAVDDDVDEYDDVDEHGGHVAAVVQRRVDGADIECGGRVDVDAK